MTDFITPQQSQTLIELLAEDDAISRASAARALGKAREGRAVLVLLNMVHDENEEVRATVAEALGMLRVHRAIKSLQ